MIRPFLDFITKENLFVPKTPVLLAISGGMDSVVMAELFYLTHQNFAIAHCNFKLRGNESVEDEQFVEDLAGRLGVKCFIEQFDTSKVAADKRISIQMAARELRYKWFEKIRIENGYHFIATAHHLNDSIETVLLNITKGTGIAGLHGILPKSEKLVRPMLFATREDIEAFATERKIGYRTDSSNSLTKYERNRIRLEVIPILKTINPNLEHTLAQSIAHFSEAELLYNEAINRYVKRLLVKRENEFLINIAALLNIKAKATVLFELLKPFHFNESTIQQIVDSLTAEPGKQFHSPTHRLLKDRKSLIISPVDTTEQLEFLLEIKEQKIKLKQFTLELSIEERNSFSIPANNQISCLDISKLSAPLLLRRWKKGDYFYPLGMKNKKKKISDYLIDQKIPLTGKENIYVIESAGKIACILGERIDERFKIKPGTTEVLVIEVATK